MKYLTITLFVSLFVFCSSCDKVTPIKTNNQIDSLITIKSINPNDTIVDCKSFTDLTPIIAPAFINAYGEAKFPNIDYEQLIFSPKGTYLAIVISQICSGDPEQVWIIDIKNNRIQLAVEKIIKDKLGFGIADVYWKADDTLIVKGHQVFWENQGKNRYVIFHSTIDGYTFKNLSNIDPFNDSINHLSSTGKYEVTFPNKKTIKLKNITTNRIQLFTDRSEYWWDEDIKVSWSPEDKYFFFSWNHGHGELSLYEGITEPKYKVVKLANGSWELEGFAVSPISQEIAYADDHSIFIYNLDDNKVSKRFKTGGYPDVIGWSVQNQISFNAINCNRPMESWETKNDFAPWGTKRLYVIRL